MLLTLLGTVFSGIFAGGATGLLGVVLQRFFDFLNAKTNLAADKQKLDHELEMRKIDVQITDKEWAGRVQVAVKEGEAAEAVAANQAFASSLFKEPERYSSTANISWGQQWILVLLDAARGIVRPALTVYLCALTTYVWWEVHLKLAIEDLSEDQTLEIWKMVIGTILYLTTTCILWWFGTRNKQQAPLVSVK